MPRFMFQLMYPASLINELKYARMNGSILYFHDSGKVDLLLLLLVLRQQRLLGPSAAVCCLLLLCSCFCTVACEKSAMSSVVDNLVTHPNVMNGAMLSWPQPGMQYVEGYALDEFCAGRCDLMIVYVYGYG